MLPKGHIPKNQFSRPSVDLSVPEVKREWQVLPATHIEPGDTVPDFGIVESVAQMNERVDPTILIRSTMGNEQIVSASEQCYFFGRVR